MRITLAYPWEGNPPDTTLEVDDVLGRRLLRDGKARAAAASVEEHDNDVEQNLELDLDEATISELRRYARLVGIVLAPEVRKRAEIIDAIRAARAAEPESTPDAGDDHQEATDVR